MNPLNNRTPIQLMELTIAQTTPLNIAIITLEMPLPTARIYSISPTPVTTHLMIIHPHPATTPTKVGLIISHSQIQMWTIHLSQPIIHLRLNRVKNSRFLSFHY